MSDIISHNTKLFRSREVGGDGRLAANFKQGLRVENQNDLPLV